MLLYRGTMAGPPSSAGNGANRLCLPAQPTDTDASVTDDGGGHLTAVQYYTAEYNAIAGFENLRYLNQYEVPCAVCISDRSQGFTTWGSNVCPAGASTQYGGLIMSDRVLRTSFECVEKRHPEPARSPCRYCLKNDGTEDEAKTTESSCEAVVGNTWAPRHQCLASKVQHAHAGG